MDKADQIMNGDRPVVQQSTEYEGCVEIHWPERDEVTVMSEMVAMQMFSDMMRIITDLDPDNQPDFSHDDVPR